METDRVVVRGCRRGFTLLELVLVICIIGVLSAIAIPRYANANNHYRVSAVARRIAADIALTRNRARALSAAQSIVFNTTTNQYQIVGMSDPDHANSTYTVSLSDRSLPARLSNVSFSNGTLTFNGYGIPAAGGTITIVSGTSSTTLTIDADTGKCTLP